MTGVPVHQGAMPTTLSSRLTRALLPWLALIWILSGAAVALHVQRGIERRLDVALMESAERLLDLAAHEVDELRASTGRSGMAALALGEVAVRSGNEPRGEALVYQIVNREGQLLLRSGDAPTTRFEVELAPGMADAGPWRVYTLAHQDEPLLIHVADSLPQRDALRWTTLVGLLLPLLAVLPLLGLLIRGVTRAKLAPVGKLASDIGERGGNNLCPLGAEELPAELVAIRDSTNHLLQRLSDALDTERALAANAAHELRTPLTTTRLHLRTLREQLTAPMQRTQIDAALASLDQLSRRAEKLLQLSRAESGASLAREQVNLAQVAAGVAEDFWADPAGLARIELIVPPDRDVLVAGDADALAVAIRNLLENALRHVSEGRIDLIIEAPGTVKVRDRGPCLPPAALAAFQTRHLRRVATGQAATGYGLGLSIVQTIVARHGGRLEFRSPAPGLERGLEVRIDLEPIPSPNPAVSSRA